VSLKFLIIDDHAEYRRLLSYHVAAHWPEAIIREYDPLQSGRLPDAFSGAGNDVVLLGDTCGREDAIEWLRRFRAQPKFPPVIFIGNGDERQVVAAIKSGADEYVGKPRLNNSRLVEAIEEALRIGSDPRQPLTYRR
jgi:DNA-binding response OmpR family regulator